MNRFKIALIGRAWIPILLIVAVSMALTTIAAHAEVVQPTPTSTVEFPGEIGRGLTRAPGGVILTGTMGTHQIVDGGTMVTKVWDTGPGEAVIHDAGVLYVGTSRGTLQRWDTPSALAWEVPIGRTVTDVAFLEGRGYLLVSSDGPTPLVVVRASDGWIPEIIDLTGYVRAMDLSPDKTRAVVVGKHLVAEGDDSRPHVLVYNVDGLGVTVSDWTNSRAQKHCRKTPADGTRPPRPDFAHFTDVEWSPGRGPMAGYFALSASGGLQLPDTGWCDSLTVLRGDVDRRVGFHYSSRTCWDTLTAVGWSRDGEHIAVGGHHKCAEWVPGGVRDWGRDPANPIVNGDREVMGDQAFEWARTNAMGLHLLDAVTGHKVPVTYFKCRAYGSRAILGTPRGFEIAHDCNHFGSTERRWVPPELRNSVDAAAYAHLPGTP